MRDDVYNYVLHGLACVRFIIVIYSKNDCNKPTFRIISMYTGQHTLRITTALTLLFKMMLQDP
jgi:hypothetical protein